MRTIEVWDVKGNFIGEYPSINRCAKEIGCTVATVHSILTGKTKKSKLFQIKYVQ